MLRLIKRGVAATQRPSGHNIREGFATDRGGAIPGNLFQCGNNESSSHYMSALKKAGKKIHPARFPADIPRFFINFLTDAGDIVLDPFAGSNTTGYIAESLDRNWVAIEINEEYLRDSIFRFQFPQTGRSDLLFGKEQQLYPSLVKEPKIG
jgi:DNA modification methylase